jgi:hypothetical protein
MPSFWSAKSHKAELDLWHFTEFEFGVAAHKADKPTLFPWNSMPFQRRRCNTRKQHPGQEIDFYSEFFASSRDPSPAHQIELNHL